jgi:vitamin B12 transporter
MTTAVLLVLLGALSRLIPHPPNFVALGALALYAGARLPNKWAIEVPLLALALSDLVLDAGTGRAVISGMRLTIYATFAVIVLAGRLARTQAGPRRLAGLAAGASSLFFVTSNFAEWIVDPLYPKTAAGLALCYAAAIPFFWNTLAADLLGTAVLFGLDALARRQRAALATAAILAVLLCCATPAHAQQPPPASESIVVTATSIPEDEKDVGSAITVVTREELEKHEAVVVSDVLRSIPGLDVSQSGTPGSVTSLFTRGTNSTQTLVLVDGVRLNSPYFGGYDWSAMTTENIDRIEVVRGPFSALYGSDAIGGVVQVFTRPGADGVSGRATGEAGNQGQGEGSAFVSAGEGPFSAAASYRYTAFNGDSPNTDWRQRNGSASLQAHLGDSGRIGVEWGLLDGEVGSPGAIGGFGYPSAARVFTHEARVSVPANVTLSDSNTLAVLVGGVKSEPSYRDSSGGFESQTDARTFQASVSDTARLGANTLTTFASWERWQVTDASNFGSNLDDVRTTLWGLGAQDTVTLGAFTVTAGLRYDHYSAYGDSWSPRGTISWLSADKLWKVRASGGTGFRAPSIGELYYPFSGNPDLKPERSVSAEVGGERYFGNGRAEVSVFWNDLKDLIVYDFATFRDINIGHARTYGAEVGWQQTLIPELAVNVTYMYLRTKDVATGDPLLRRPENGATLGLSWMPIPTLNLSPRLLYVGSRADADPGTGDPITDPSYLRVDLIARWQATPNLAPYLRLINLTNHAYEEVAGYPAAGRLASFGLDVKF